MHSTGVVAVNKLANKLLLYGKPVFRIDMLRIKFLKEECTQGILNMKIKEWDGGSVCLFNLMIAVWRKLHFFAKIAEK